MKKILLSVFIPVFALVLSTSVVSAQTVEDEISTLQSQIDRLLGLVEQLQDRMTELKSENQTLRQDINEARDFIRDLSEGMTSEDIKDLQELLSGYSDIYPEAIISGYFGPLTRQAVKRFQKRLGIDDTGYVGPLTRTALNKLLDDGVITADEEATLPAGIRNGRGLDKPLPPGILKNIRAKRGFANPLRSVDVVDDSDDDEGGDEEENEDYEDEGDEE